MSPNYQMNKSNNNNNNGYVYILEVKDIDLPVCKIGMTSRNPIERCAEINNSSTGDFIWEVAYQIAVDDCKKLEAIVHKKLEPLRQKKREFFNINAEDAIKAIKSIIDNQSEVKTIDKKNIKPKIKLKKDRKITFSKTDSLYTEFLQAFTEILDVKGRPFGQLNKPIFGMSDGKEGVQWNIMVSKEIRDVKVGVNLEGKVYSNWPIATFILSELKNSSVNEIKTKLDQPENIFVRFSRDAWQGPSRSKIIERYIGRKEFSFLELEPALWKSILKEALGCLDETRMYRGRNKQSVTLVRKSKNETEIKEMEVSPHLTIWTPIKSFENINDNLNKGISRLKPIHEWINRVSQ